MTILSSVQNACRYLNQDVPSALVSSTEAFQVNILAVANQVAKSIARAHDWRLFTTLKTQAGDGTTTAFSLPADYDRMPVEGKIFLTSLNAPLTRVYDMEDWLRIQINNTGNVPGWWIILGGMLNIYPAMASTNSAKYYYQSNLIIAPSSGSNKTEFTLDTDTFRLSEHVLTLGIIYRWRAAQGLEAMSEMANFNVALAQEVARDKGPRVLKIGRLRMPDGVTPAYPGTVGS